MFHFYGAKDFLGIGLQLIARGQIMDFVGLGTVCWERPNVCHCSPKSSVVCCEVRIETIEIPINWGIFPFLGFYPGLVEAETQELEPPGRDAHLSLRHVEWLPLRRWEVMEKEVTKRGGMWRSCPRPLIHGKIMVLGQSDFAMGRAHSVFPTIYIDDFWLVGGLEHVLWLSIYWEFHHPNWLLFFRAETTNYQSLELGSVHWPEHKGVIGLTGFMTSILLYQMMEENWKEMKSYEKIISLMEASCHLQWGYWVGCKLDVLKQLTDGSHPHR